MFRLGLKVEAQAETLGFPSNKEFCLRTALDELEKPLISPTALQLTTISIALLLGKPT